MKKFLAAINLAWISLSHEVKTYIPIVLTLLSRFMSLVSSSHQIPTDVVSYLIEGLDLGTELQSTVLTAMLAAVEDFFPNQSTDLNGKLSGFIQKLRGESSSPAFAIVKSFFAAILARVDGNGHTSQVYEYALSTAQITK